MAINHEMNYYNYGKTLSAEGIMMPLPQNGNNNKHEYVDLGLSVKWATCNIGASSPEEAGLYFAWGETSGYTADTTQIPPVTVGKDFLWRDYEFGEYVDQEPDYGMTKYNGTDGKTTLEPEDDAATSNWGSDWRMPKQDEFDELLENTTSSWTEVNGVSGLLLTSTVEGYEEESLFFPAVGYAEDGMVSIFGENGIYRSASLDDNNVAQAFVLYFYNEECGFDNGGIRYIGYTVRPVHI